MTLPETMRAVLVRAHGGLDQLEFTHLPVPSPGPQEVLIRLHATGLNHLDLWVRRGVATHKFPLPMIPGCDGAGEIAALGSAVQGWQVGDRVTWCPTLACYQCRQCLSGAHHLCRYFGVLGETTNGSCAEFVTLPAVNLLKLSPGMPFTTAAAIPLAALTAHHMLVHRAMLAPGETILIHAAGSGVGTMALQFARMIGARIFATASTDAKLAHARSLGAEQTINYTTEDWVGRVRELTGKAGVDVVFENVGADTWTGSLRSLAKGGRLVTCGATSGAIVESDLRLIFFKNLSILGSTMGSLGEMQHIWRLVEQERVGPVIDRTFPISAIREAHQQMESRQQFGKVVLTHDWD